MTASNGSNRGFTLIEVLVCLAIMSLIVTILTASVQIGGHTWQRVTRNTRQIGEIAYAQEFLRQRLSTIHPISTGTEVTPSQASLIGSRTMVEFSSTAPGSFTDGFLRFRIGLSELDSSTLEVKYCREHGPGRSELCDWAEEPLVLKTAGLSIQFWESAAGLPGHWVSSWEERARLPQLIRIDVQFAPNDLRRWAPLYIEPRIDTNALCIFDVVSRRCRESI